MATVYGYSTEGYAVARQMAINGADVYIIDESTPSAISLTAEIAKAYPDIYSLKEDEPLLQIKPIEEAVSKTQYLFFAPRVRKSGQDTKTEIHSRFKDVVSSLKKNSSVVYALPTGFNGNSESIMLLEHVTGFEAGKTISYYYYPLGESTPDIIGSFDSKDDERLAGLLSDGAVKKSFVPLSSSEYLHAIDTLSGFSRLCSILEVCKLAHEEQAGDEFSSDGFENLFLHDMIKGLYDLNALKASLEGANPLMYLINVGIKGTEAYVKRLTDEIRATLKKNDLKASKTKIVLSWTLDQYEVRGDRIRMLQHLTSKLRDYITDVEARRYTDAEPFHSDKVTLVIACSKADYDSMEKSEIDGSIILVKANPLCEIIYRIKDA